MYTEKDFDLYNAILPQLGPFGNISTITVDNGGQTLSNASTVTHKPQPGTER